jgi:lambda repressor-like predicted transcriptional regulator
MSKNALANIDPAPILERIQRGDSLRTIAADLGVSNVGLRAWLLREDKERYSEVITAALTTRVAEADEGLDAADDVISIARAREQARFARMDLERRRPQLYGMRQQVTHDVGPDLAVMLRDARKRVSTAQQTLPNAVQHGQIIEADAKRVE